MSNLILDPSLKVQLDHDIEKALYLPYYCSFSFEPHFMVRLSPFLLNTWLEIKTTAVVLLPFVLSNSE